MGNTNACPTLHFFSPNEGERNWWRKQNTTMMLHHIIIFSGRQQWKTYFTISLHVYCQLLFSLWTLMTHTAHYPGFGWDRAHFLPSSWYSAAFWIQYENNVEGTVMFWLLLSSSCPRSRTLQGPILCQWGGAWGAGRAWPGQVTWTGPRDIPYHRTPRPGYKLGQLDVRGQSLLGNGLGLGLQVVSHCTGHHMPSFLVLSSPYNHHYILFQLINSSYFNSQVFPFLSSASPPHSTSRFGLHQTRGWRP